MAIFFHGSQVRATVFVSILKSVVVTLLAQKFYQNEKAIAITNCVVFQC